VRKSDGVVHDEGNQAVTSLSPALSNGVPLADVGSLLWVVIRQMVPCDAMAVFALNRSGTHVGVRYAAGEHTDLLETLTRPVASGVVGWAAVTRRSVLNADPMFDLGVRANLTPALRAAIVVPLVDNGNLIAVLALYSKDLPFTAEQVTLLEVLAPRIVLSLAATSVPLQMEARARLHPRLRLVPSMPSAGSAD
jgi:GAF domain-containing protein